MMGCQQSYRRTRHPLLNATVAGVLSVATIRPITVFTRPPAGKCCLKSGQSTLNICNFLSAARRRLTGSRRLRSSFHSPAVSASRKLLIITTILPCYGTIVKHQDCACPSSQEQAAGVSQSTRLSLAGVVAAKKPWRLRRVEGRLLKSTCDYRLNRRRTTLASPSKPVASRTSVPGSGTLVAP